MTLAPPNNEKTSNLIVVRIMLFFIKMFFLFLADSETIFFPVPIFMFRRLYNSADAHFLIVSPEVSLILLNSLGN